MNLRYLRKKAKAWLKRYTRKPWTSPMDQLYRDYFYFHFYNLPNPRKRLGCYICYQVEGTQTYLPMPFKKGVFENQFWPRERRHAELCFISWFRNQKEFLDRELFPGEKYRVTWYTSWSPCVDCVQDVIEFLEENENMELRVFVARLYYSYDAEHRQGLRRLYQAGAQVEVMSSQEFEHCWETFVDHRGTPFFPWADIDENCQELSMALKRILQEN
ncbi:DNA dC-_dU-editing enzyme APOBEC-3Ca-like isoform 2-T2 [Hipposideros larvatus]